MMMITMIVSYLSLANIPLSPETAQDQERRIRREIANSNERRRMQSINAGFQSLKTLLPHTDGEKLSKVSAAGEEEDSPVVEVVTVELNNSVFLLVPARPPSCNRRQTTSSPWSRRRRSCWLRTTS